MNRREFIVGSSAAVATAAVVGIPTAQPVYFGMDLGAGESFTLSMWQRNVLIAIWDAAYKGRTADEAIKFVETVMRLPAACPFAREGGQ